jgi:hypothetical protein
MKAFSMRVFQTVAAILAFVSKHLIVPDAENMCHRR